MAKTQNPGFAVKPTIQNDMIDQHHAVVPPPLSKHRCEQVLCALEPPETVTPWSTLKTQCRETQYKENTRGAFIQYIHTIHLS